MSFWEALALVGRSMVCHQPVSRVRADGGFAETGEGKGDLQGGILRGLLLNFEPHILGLIMVV